LAAANPHVNIRVILPHRRTPPIMARTPTYLNFGFRGASNFWLDVAIPAQTRYFQEPTPRHAVEAAWPTCHVIDWLWHEHNPGQDTRTIQRSTPSERAILQLAQSWNFCMTSPTHPSIAVWPAPRALQTSPALAYTFKSWCPE
jgi:hypothetical protein